MGGDNTARLVLEPAFRVGITGRRDMDPGDPAVMAAMTTILDLVRRRCVAAAPPPSGPEASASNPDLVLLSSLAEGADRLAAHAALAAGYRLTAVLPFPAALYRQDFPASATAFDELLQEAGPRVLALDAGRSAADWRAYQAAGRVVVRNCDLLIAVWDDAIAPKGRGGTEDTMRFALHVGVPVVWIHPDGKHAPVLLVRATTFPARSRRQPADSLAELAALVDARLAHAEDGADADGTAFRKLLDEPTPAHAVLWDGHQVLTRLLGSSPPAIAAEPEADKEPVTGPWRRLFQAADARASAYAARYRSSYTYVILLAALALSFAVSALVEEVLHLEGLLIVTAGAEAICLGLILALVLQSRRARWHERSIALRLLAELCRKQEALAEVGWSLLRREVTRTTTSRIPECAWAVRLFDAAVRATPLRSGAFSPASVAAVQTRARQELLQGQRAYHSRRAATSEQVAGNLLHFAAGCFFVTLACVLLKLLVLVAEGPGWALVALGWAAAVLPAASAAAFAMRAYAEYEVMSDQSERMVELLDDMTAELDDIDPALPLASQALGAVLDALTTAMLADIVDWAQLFQVKIVETG